MITSEHQVIGMSCGYGDAAVLAVADEVAYATERVS